MIHDVKDLLIYLLLIFISLSLLINNSRFLLKNNYF